MDRLSSALSYTTIKPGSADDLFICCASFEERSSAVAWNLFDYKTCATFMFSFTETDRRGLRQHQRDLIREKMVSRSGMFFDVRCDLGDPVTGVTQFLDLCKTNGIGLTNQAISLDITTFTKQYLLVLLKMLDMIHSGNQIRILYAYPAEYSPRKLTEGSREIRSVPLWGGQLRQDKQTLLILFLGFERDRAIGVWERYEPQETIAVIGSPAYHEGWERRAAKLNRDVFDLMGVRGAKLSARDPVDVYQGLENLCKDKWSEFNICIAPFGTKMQTVGIYMFAKDHPDVQLVYSVPQRYFEGYYSKGVGGFQEFRLWEGR